ncbi:MAG: type I CRISPR-associated protein Cas7 [Rubripirellula sp.]
MAFNRGTGLIIIEARCSNPNGDPDQESEPRTISTDGRGVISPVSFKRKLRDIVADKEGDAWKLASETLGLGEDGYEYEILESRGRKRDEIIKMDAESFNKKYWDARVFGNTFLESMEKGDRDGKEHFISTGTVQVGVGVSIAPVEIERMTTTNKAGVEADKDRGMAPLGFRVVQHAIYTMPFFVNPMMARKNGCTEKDIELLKFLIPHAYSQTASAIRPFVSVLHAWYAEHKNPLGSCPDPLIIDAMSPTKEDSEAASTMLKDYVFPTQLDDQLLQRLEGFVDLCA